MSTPSDDLAEIAGKVEKIVRDLQAEKEQNRRDFPLSLTYVDALERVNPSEEKSRPRLIWAEENGRRIGRERD